uniref:RRM domain-containing protein n=1 Tax=Caenorhabditis tropicalis TaxID=1561998 RepID=A0A1I7V3P8_9PELO
MPRQTTKPATNDSPAEKKKAANKSEESSTTPNEKTASDTPENSTRPRRTIRKNTFYNNDQYDLQQSGPINAESSEKEASSSKPAPSVSRESPVPSTSRKRALPEAKKPAKTPKNSEESKTVKEKSKNDDDGPPLLGPSLTYPEEMEADDNIDDDDSRPPDLERNPLSKRRGRPKKPELQESNLRFKLPRPNQRVVRVPAENVAARTVAASNRNIKLFEDELETTPEGDTYATVLNGCLTELLRKERIIGLLTCPEEYGLIQDAGWLMEKVPRLPPLIADKGAFVFYVNGANCKNAKDLSFDDLRPWSSTSDATVPNSLNIKPNVRRHPVADFGGVLKIVKHDARMASYHLTEYSARLPREERLRKKIFYLTRNNKIYGNVLILYDYVRAGNIPMPISLPHGNDLLRSAVTQELEPDLEHDSPFESDTYEGLRGGFYLKLRASKLGWAHNKKQLLDYLFNKPEQFLRFSTINHRLPDLPPLITTVGVFAYFVPSEHIVNQLHHAADGLSPWTTIPGGPNENTPAPRVRSTRRALILEQDGTFSLARESRQPSEWYLVETMTTLARCKRLRKRLFYIQQNNSMLTGNVCYIYEFLQEGPIPTLMPSMEQKHFGSATRYPVQPEKKEEQNEMDMVNNQEGYADEMLIPIDDEEIDMGMNIHKPSVDRRHHEVVAEVPEEWPDMPEGGYDVEFMEDAIEKAENPEAYYDLARQVSTGHIYLTVRHKKVVTALDHVLEWIANSNFVEDRGILNDNKPGHPPMVANSRAYVFFVAGTAIFPHDINRDDFSPWSHNGNSTNPVCYRTKVRKIGVVCDPQTSHFLIKDNNDYKSCPFHLVYLYSICPKDPRLRKKIYYMMETQSKMVVSHALILYDYATEGEIVKLTNQQYKPVNKVPPALHQHEYLEELSTPEENRLSPFRLPVETAIDGTLYMQVTDIDFWNDRNRQLQYLVNQPNLIELMGCLNNKVPDLPPPCTDRGIFVFFINGEEVSYRSLTVDKLVPWSENVSTNPNGVTKRPKSSKTPLGLNIQNQLRILKCSSGVLQEPSDYQLHVYTATLPRCCRLRKKVVYVQQDGRPCGHAMIMYSYTEPGEMPVPLDRYAPSPEEWLNTMNEAVRDDIIQLAKTMPSEEVVRLIQQDHGIRININMVIALKKSDLRKTNLANAWAAVDETPKMEEVEEVTEEVVIEEQVPSAIMDHEMIVDGEIIIEQTEVIENSFDNSFSRRNPLLEKSVHTTGFVRGSQRFDALWRIAQKQFGSDNIDETFDDLFRLLYEKNEERLLQQIRMTFNVDIQQGENPDLVDDPNRYIHEPYAVDVRYIDHMRHPQHYMHLEPTRQDIQYDHQPIISEIPTQHPLPVAQLGEHSKNRNQEDDESPESTSQITEPVAHEKPEATKNADPMI